MTTKCILDGRMSIYSTCIWSLNLSLLILSDTPSTKRLRATRSLKVFWYIFIFSYLISYFVYLYNIWSFDLFYAWIYPGKKFILCICIWNQMHNIMFQLWNYIWEFYSSLYYILILKCIIWFILIWLSFISK